jgi:hypothetical protein
MAEDTRLEPNQVRSLICGRGTLMPGLKLQVLAARPFPPKQILVTDREEQISGVEPP